MTDWNEAVATTDTVEDPIGNAAERGIEQVRAIVAELLEAGRSAAQSVLDEQKQGAARQTGAIAAAVRAAAQSLDHSSLPTLAHYADRAAGGVESFSHALSGRGWSELADDVEILARRRPTLFIALAAAAGFLAGRLVWASSERAAAARRRQVAQRMEVERESEAVTAAVASGRGEEDLAAPVAGLAGPRDVRP